MENRQKVGRWLEAGKHKYYLSGVSVSRKLYEDDPEKWEAEENGSSEDSDDDSPGFEMILTLLAVSTGGLMFLRKRTGK